MQHKQILAQGGNVHYWIDKKDDGVDCIVFTHGVTADHTMFEKQIEFFSDKYTIVLWDVPMQFPIVIRRKYYILFFKKKI